MAPRYSWFGISAYLLLCGVLLGNAPAVWAQGKPAPVVIGYQTVAAPWVFGWKSGAFDRAMGVKTDWKEFAAGTDVNLALASGSIAFGYLGSAPSSIGIAQNLKYKVIFIPAVDKSEVILGRAEKGISGLKDCVGQKLGVPFGSTAHYRVASSLDALKIDKARVTLVDMPPKDIAAAWRRGDINCASIWDPVTSDILSTGGKVLLDNAQMKSHGIVTADVWAVSESFAAKNPEMVKGFVKAAAEAVDYYSDHKADVQAKVAAAFGVKLDDMRRTMDLLEYPPAKEQLGPEWLGSHANKGGFANVLHSSAEFFKSIGRIPVAPTLAKYQDAIAPEYLEAVKR